MLEALYSNKNQILKKTLEFFQNSSSLIPKIGCELEFFLLPKRDNFFEELSSGLKERFSLIYEIQKEQGANQIELKTSFTSDLSRLCSELEFAKSFIKNFADQKNLTASFSSQPFIDDCGSALQFNISLHDSLEKNLFKSDEKLLVKVAAGMLEMTNSMMIFLAPKEEDYLRFSYELNRNLFKKGKFSAPVNLSFGTDNRTCAIRIPSIIHDSSAKRLEYRLAAADANPQLCISVILLAILYGIQNELPTPNQIHGNAFDEQYQLKNFCQSLVQAKEKFLEEGNFIRKKLEEFCSS